MHRLPGNIEAVIFDMDGTLIDSMPSHLEAWRLTAEQFGFPFDKAWHHSLGGVPSRETVGYINQRYGLTLDALQVSEAKKAIWETNHSLPELIAETHQLFLALIGNKKLAVGTGASRNHAEPVLRQLEIFGNLDALVTATDVKNGKPAPDTFATAAEKMGVRPEHCIVFEDTAIGKQAAEAAGMQCILVLDKRIQWPNPGQCTA